MDFPHARSLLSLRIPHDLDQVCAFTNLPTARESNGNCSESDTGDSSRTYSKLQKLGTWFKDD